MMKRYIIILLTAFTTGCSYEIELPINSGEGKLFVEAFPIAGNDTTYFNIYSSRPANTPKEKNGGAPEITSINLTVNGEKCAVEKKEDGKRKYFSTRRLEKGDVLSFRIEAENFPPVTSTVTIPKGPDYKLERKLTNKGFVYHSLVFPDSSNDKEYHYGVRITRRFEVESASWDLGSRRYNKWHKDDVMFPKIIYSSFGEKNEMLGFRSIKEMFVGGVYSVIMENLEGVDNELVLSIPQVYNMYYSLSPIDTTIRRFQYKIDVLSIDDATYKYLNPKIDYFLMSAGLVPPFANTSNINGGYGMFGRIGISSTGWIENVDPKIY